MSLFPSIEPYASGMLDVGDCQSVYWECCGNPHGKPALYLHGGPGGGSRPGARRYFDPERFRVVLFDQRGCGRSRPSAADPRVLAGVTTTSTREVQWITEDVGRIFPREWGRFAGAVPEQLRNQRLVDAYSTLLADPDPLVREHAAREWCLWEDAHVSLTPGHRPNPRYEDPDFRYLFARLVTHYWRNAAFLPDDQLVREAASLDGIPGALIHGRYDVSGPLETAWRLHERWSTGELHVINDAGHGGGDTFLNTLVGSVSTFAGEGSAG